MFKSKGITNKMMKLTTSQTQRLAEKILNQWKSQNLITFKVDEKQVLRVIVETLVSDFKREEDLDKEVYLMLEKIESEHGEGFQRGKMFPLLKQKIAKERKIIL